MGGGGGSGKVYLLYTCENVDNCEKPLRKFTVPAIYNKKIYLILGNTTVLE